MSLWAIFLLAVGLAMDATAVAAARGMAARHIRPRDVLLVALLFGGAQAAMPALGWLIGARVGPFIAAWDHWVVFAVLGAIGGHMIWEARQPPKQLSPAETPFALKVLVLLAIATSIDALAAGFTLPMLDAPFALSLATIGVVTALLSAIGLFAGRRFGAVLGARLDIAGGLVLIGLGVRILVEHLRAA